jgi:spore germination protein D
MVDVRYRLPLLGALIGMTFALVSCGQESGSSSNQVSYKEVKTMVIDILGSQEAQQALQKASETQLGGSTLHMKGMTVQDQQQIRLAVKDVLISPDYDKILEGIMKDPKFAGEFAKAVSKDNIQICSMFCSIQ